MSQHTLLTRSRIATVAIAAVALVGVAWGAQNQGARAASQQETEGTVALVGGVTVDRSELVEAAQEQLEGVEMEKLQCESAAEKKRYDVMAFNLERLVRQRLADLGAEDAGLDREAFILQEKETRTAAVTDAAVDRFIASNQRLARTPREQIAPQVKAFLAENAMYEALEEKYSVDRTLEPYRVAVDGGNGVIKGAENAKIEIVEFSDFQCPYCKQVNPALNGVVEKYGDKVKLVFRQFPLTSIHPEAFKAAEASLCASDQGKFWEMHDLLFEEQRQLSIENLKEKAQRLGLNKAKFDACLDGDNYTAQVQTDLQEGALAGVTGTPALFINGRPYSGNRTVDAMSEVIEDELKRVGR